MTLPTVLQAGKTVLLLCDIQTKFRTAIHGFDQVVTTAQKMLKFAKLLECPVILSEQNPRALGSTVSEIDIEPLGPLHLATIEKTSFSMVTPEVTSLLHTRHTLNSVILLGIESHVCVLQTALDLISKGYAVHVLADGVSSCNKEEVPYALARISRAGGHVTTSESAAFELMRDAGRPEFKAFSAVIKEDRERTKRALEVLASEQ